MTEARTKELYVEVEKELQESIITVADASSSPLYMQDPIQKAQPVASLVIPNKMYLLWDRKISLQKKLGINSSKRLELANERIGGTLKVKLISSVKTRLEKESSRCVKLL